jgi:hypothetical protein
MKRLYKVGNIVNVKSPGYECRAKPIQRVGMIYYTIEGRFCQESDVTLTHEVWEPGMNVTVKSDHVAAGPLSLEANYSILKMMEN